MARRCSLSKKKGRSANNVSHSNRKTKRRQEANLQWKRFRDPETGKVVRIKVSTSVLRTITKKGLQAVLKKNNVSL
jgi:large subunit ribosomal protein L28